jgi:putative SOS response-associated peptidase YedK
MWGRYRLSRAEKQVAEHFDIPDEIEWSPCYNIASGQRVAIVRQDPRHPVCRFSLMTWGLIPSWARDAIIGFKTINARAETVAAKPAYRDSFKNRRCLIPADGFYEWVRNGKSKQPFHFSMHDGSLFTFAGI